MSRRFRVALSFPGEKRAYIRDLAEGLGAALGREAVFYDAWYEAELARLDFDTYLQQVYRDHAEWIVVALCAEYAGKEWCGLEWRAIRELIKGDRRDRIVLVRFDNAEVDGVFSHDGYLDARKREPAELAALILQRVGVTGVTGEAGRVAGQRPGRRPGEAAGRHPRYGSDEVRALSEKLLDADARKRALVRAGEDTGAVTEEILALKRAIRRGGQLKAGGMLGRYLLFEVIGRGGFATVWRAAELGEPEAAAGPGARQVAIKVLHGELGGDVIRRERFLRGARMMDVIEHEAVVRVIEPQCEDDGYHYFVMELVTGGSLHQAVLDGRVGREQAVVLIRRVAEALAVAHARGYVHRDIKPANILLDEDGTPKLTDFDLVAVAETTGGTRTGAMGTFLYAAPEQLDRPQDVDARADVYSLAMTLVFVLHGAKLPMTLMASIPRFIDGLACSDGLKAVLARALDWDRDQRYADAGAFGAALESADVAVSEDTALVRLVELRGGTFVMGSPESEAERDDDEGPQHEVLVSGFAMGETPVTQGQWEAVMGGNPSFAKYGIGEDLPVNTVSWFAAIEFCNRLSEREGLAPCYRVTGEQVEWVGTEGYRLPTEAEWEYACRAGTSTAYSFGDDPSLLDRYAWYDDNAGNQVQPVASKEPNGWGLHDMHGNVWEWCWDWFGQYSGERQKEPRGPVNGTQRVLRGGAFWNGSWFLRCAIRFRNQPGFVLRNFGFRVVRGPRRQHG